MAITKSFYIFMNNLWGSPGEKKNKKIEIETQSSCSCFQFERDQHMYASFMSIHKIDYVCVHNILIH